MKTVRSRWKFGMRAFLLLMLSVCAAIVFSGCAPETSLRTSDTNFSDQPCRISLFLNLKRPDCKKIWTKISSIEILSDAQIWIPLNIYSEELVTGTIKTGQTLLARGQIPAGVYTKIRLTINKAALIRGKARLFLALDNPEMILDLSKPLYLSKGDSTCAFITWDVDASLVGTALLKPVMSASPQTIPLITDLAYVACPDFNTVYQIRTDKNWVCGAVGISGFPTYLQIYSSKNRLYVLCAKEADIKVIESSTNRQVDVLQIPLIQEPEHMILGPNGEYAYLIDKWTNQLVKISLQSGSMEGRVRVGDRPGYMVYLSDQDRVAVSSEFSQSIFLVDPSSITVTEKIAVGGTPQGLLSYDGKLYIAEADSNTICVYNLQTGRILKRINVGNGPRRLLENNEHIYVTNYDSQTISVLLPSQLNVQKDISLKGRPLEMAVSEKRRWLYVGDGDSKGIWVIDLTSNRINSFITLGTKPLGIAVIQ